MAPTTMPKLSPRPARIGISSDSTSNALRAKRASISRSRNSGLMCAAHAPNTHSSTNSSGTAACVNRSRSVSRGLAWVVASMVARLATSAISAARERVQDHAVLDDEPRGLGDVALDYLDRDRKRDGQDRLEQQGADDDVRERGARYRRAADQQARHRGERHQERRGVELDEAERLAVDDDPDRREDRGQHGRLHARALVRDAGGARETRIAARGRDREPGARAEEQRDAEA